MTNTYAINVTRQKEFKVCAELEALGLKPWLPLALSHTYVKEKRDFVWYDKPYLPKFMVCVIPAIYWRDVVDLKHVIGKPVRLSQRDIDGQAAYVVKGTGKHVPAVPGLKQFKAAVEAEYADMQRKKVNSEYQCLYEPGQALEILSGPFEGFRAVFRKSIKQAHDDYAKLRVEVEVFGRASGLDIDPDKVRVYG